MEKTLADKFEFDVRADVAKMLLDSVAKGPSNPTPFNTALFLKSRADSYAVAALDYYLLNMWSEAKETAREIPSIAQDYFFGDWRAAFVSDCGKGQGHEALRRCSSWMGVFEGCILWGAALGEWGFLKKIAEYPADDADIGSGGFDQVDLLVFLALSSLLQDNQQELRARLLRLTSEGGERGKLVSGVIQALTECNEGNVSDALGKYLAFFKKREFPKRNIFKKVSVLGTFVHHYNQHVGLEIKIDPKFIDHIVSFNKAPGSRQKV